MSDTLTKQDIDGVVELVGKQKKATEDLQAQMADIARISGGTDSALKELETQLMLKIKTVGEHAENLERQIKGKVLGDAEQAGFAKLLNEGLEKDWTEIQKFRGSSKGKVFQLSSMKAAADMTIANSVTDPGAYFTTVQPGIRALPNRRVHMRDIINLGTMSTSSIDYVREEDTTEGNLTTVAEGAAKPQIQPKFSERQAVAQYIAGWLRISRKMLDDMQALRSFLQMRLMEMYLKVEDAQILNGDGVSPNLEGILTVAAALTDTTGADIELIIKAIAQLESADYTATGVVLHPAAYYYIAINKAVGSGEYDLPGIVVISNGQLFIAGVPVYKTTAMARNEFVVGDWQLGAQLFIRDQPVVEFFDQDANNVTTNQITVRIEGRVALAIYRAEAFVKGTFNDVPVS